MATDDGERTRLRSLGLARSAELSWSAIARRHVAVWDEARRIRRPVGPWLIPGCGSRST